MRGKDDRRERWNTEKLKLVGESVATSYGGNTAIQKYVTERMPYWEVLVKKVDENDNYLYQCGKGFKSEISASNFG